MQLVDLVGDRKQVSELVLENAIPDLEKLGIVVQTFNIQNFEDANGVIENLGVDKTSAIRKAAAISKANAERDISVAQSQAKKDANDAAVAAELEIAQKQNDLAVKKANLQKISDTEKAIADAAYEIQKQTQQKAINVAQAEAEVAKQEKEIEIRERMVMVTEKELKAQIEKKAEAERQAQIQRSEAELFQQQKDAEADRYKEEQRAKAIKQIADAEKEKAFAEAEATKAKAMAEAEATKAKGLAEAEAIKAQGLAEAEALNKKAEAMKLYGDAARQEMQLKTIERYFEQMPQIAAAIAKPMEKIGNITMYGEGNTAKLTGDITKTLTQVTNGLTDSLGIDLRTVLGSMFGAKLAGVTKPDNTQENNK
jgi:flotillin